MTAIEYPWRWLTEAVGSSFAVRYPWVDAVRAAAERAELVCLLLPAAAGGLGGWGDWLAALDPTGPAACLAVPGGFAEVTRALADAYQVGEPFRGGRTADWARRFLADARRQMPQCNPLTLLAAGADDACAAGLEELVGAQRALGYPFARVLLVRRAAPPNWAGEVIRFGLPEIVGDLYRIAPPPARDVAFWTNLVLALTVTWEAGATPRLADELWDQLRLERTLSLRDAGFDDWLRRRLNEFAERNHPAAGRQLPDELAFGPVAAVDDDFWQSGVVACQGDRFDVTPLRARAWVRSLQDKDACEALRRRRLENIPLARWLSAWATSIEESLRVAALAAGGARFRRFLESRPPRNRRETGVRSRWEELEVVGSVEAIDAADFGDLVEFVGAANAGNGRHTNLPKLLALCRLARNRVVHERRVASDDILKIAAVVDWLSEGGLI